MDMNRSCSRDDRLASWTPLDPTRMFWTAHPGVKEHAIPGPDLSTALGGECCRELRARADPELAVDAREVYLDRLRGDEQGLRDLAVHRPFGGHLGAAPLARSERLDTAEGDAPWPSPGGAKLGLCAGREGRGAADRCQLEPTSQVLACLGAAVGSAKGRPQLGTRFGVLELRGRIRKH